jgi:cyclin D7
MEDLGHSFESNTIQWMELTLLKALGWRLSSTTAYSYMELLICRIDSLKPLQEEITTLVTNLLLAAISGISYIYIYIYIYMLIK